VFGGVTDEPVSYVNAPRIATERGVEVRESSSSTSQDYVNLVTVRGGGHAVAGTLVGLRGEPRIVMIDDLSLYLPPARHMLLVRNDDVPGMIATVTRAVADAGVNVGDLHVGHSVDGAAAMQVLLTNAPVGQDVVAALRAVPGIASVHSLAID
jgi:D-3-phosphoglycerate dehydrogenase